MYKWHDTPQNRLRKSGTEGREISQEERSFGISRRWRPRSNDIAAPERLHPKQFNMTTELPSLEENLVKEHDTLKYSLLGPSLTKSGQDDVDQQKVNVLSHTLQFRS
jgi:hypothetical protein